MSRKASGGAVGRTHADDFGTAPVRLDSGRERHREISQRVACQVADRVVEEEVDAGAGGQVRGRVQGDDGVVGGTRQRFAERLAGERRKADLIAGNNVFAHVPDINDFTAGLAAALKPEGVITLEFPHVMRLVEFCQFDTIYHSQITMRLPQIQKLMARVRHKIMMSFLK